MKFLPTGLKGCFIVEAEPFSDFRGKFMRTFCAEEFQKAGLPVQMVQSNLSVTLKKGTIRGMHYQVDGAEEDKLVRCFRGAVLDVAVDLRRGSATFGQHVKVELSESNDRALLVPRGFAHGFLTLEDNCYVFYQVSNHYSKEKERGIRWNDPFLNIAWPVKTPVVSEKDAAYPDFKAGDK